MMPNFLIPLLALISCLLCPPVSLGTQAEAEYFNLSIDHYLDPLFENHPGKSGAYVFDKGEEALLARAWLTDHAARTIDVQYFIWSSDNIGILAAESLLRAAERGVKVRVLVDDLMIDVPDRTMLTLNEHPNVQIKVYNPKHKVGVSFFRRLLNLAFEFRSANQRMHDKTFTVDGRICITGGRNMADEYFDFNHSYNFRDRDILVLGPVVHDIVHNFDQFWNSGFAVPVEQQLDSEAVHPLPGEAKKLYEELHSYARNPDNFKPEIRQALHRLHHFFPSLIKSLTWTDISFTHDMPGKNTAAGLKGGGNSTTELIKALNLARESVTIQSPYLVMPDGGIDFFKYLTGKGVEVAISTNSLASTDNLQAFSGYHKQRDKILDAGVRVFEYKPAPQIQRDLIDRYEILEKSAPTFAIHAKTMVIDHRLLFVGTFNLDPRSANLNTEVGILIDNGDLASRVEQLIKRDMLPGNSWNAAADKPDRHAALTKRFKVFFWEIWPLDPLL